MRVAGAFDDDGAELHDHKLLLQRAGQAELEDARVHVSEPVILDHVFGDDVRGQRGGAAAGRPAERDTEIGNQRQGAGLGGDLLYREGARDFRCGKHDVEERFEVLLQKIEQQGVGINRGGTDVEGGVVDHGGDGGLEDVYNFLRGAASGDVAAGGDLADGAVVLQRSGRAERSVVAVPERDVVGEHESFDGVGEVFGLEIGELLLLRAYFHVEQVVVDLRDQGLERHTSLHARGRAGDSHDVARIDEGIGRRGRVDGGLLEEARRMAGGRHLLYALPEDGAAADDICNFALVAVDFDGARPEEIGGGAEVEERSFHFLSSLWNAVFVSVPRSGLCDEESLQSFFTVGLPRFARDMF